VAASSLNPGLQSKQKVELQVVHPLLIKLQLEHWLLVLVEL
jgi:hypothetical protein